VASVQHIFDNPGRMDSLQHEDQGEIYGIDAFNDHSTFTFSFLGSVVLQTVNDAIVCMYVCMYPSGKGPAYSGPYAEAFYSRPIALTQEGRSLVNDVCECVRD